MISCRLDTIPVKVLRYGNIGVTQSRTFTYDKDMSGRSNDTRCILDTISRRDGAEKSLNRGTAPSWLHIDLDDHGNVDLKASIEPVSMQQTDRDDQPKGGADIMQFNS